jgi:hypothetical protein
MRGWWVWLLACIVLAAAGGIVAEECLSGDPAFVSADKRDRAGLERERGRARTALSHEDGQHVTRSARD